MSARAETQAPPAGAPSPSLRAWDVLPVPVLLLAPDGRALNANRSFAEATGIPGLALHGEAWLSLMGPRSRRELLAMLRRRQDFTLSLRLQRPLAAEQPADRPPPAAWFSCVARWCPGDGHFLCVLHDLSAVRRAEREARTQAEQFQLLADNVPALIATYDARTRRCQFANKLYASTFGWDTHSIVGRSVEEVVGEAAADEIRPHVETVMQEGRPVSYERRLTGADGHVRWLEVNLLPQLDMHGEPVACFVLISDITHHRLAEQAVRESEERLRAFMQASVEGIVFHTDGIIVDANPPACELLGMPLHELLGRPALDFVAPDQVALVGAVMSAAQEIGYESAVIDRRGQRIPVEFIVRITEHRGRPMRMTIIRDLRDRNATQARMHHLAQHDALTDLPNRSAFMDQLEPLLTQARENRHSLALLFIDLDHFKRVNDSLGHLAGDALLQTVAQRIVDVLRTTDLVARFGGDEFMVLLSGSPPREVVADVARKLLAAIAAPLHAEGRPISVTPSIGIAMFPDDGQTPAELIKNADTAMYRAKTRGRATLQFFDPALARMAYDALVMEGQLALALERDEFALHFQPQVRARDGVLVGAEALVRWRHPERGLLRPDAFLPVAERQRLMLPLGAWVMREAARTARRWRDMRLGGDGAVPVAVNLSTLQFQSPGFVEGVAQVLHDAGLPGHLLELELTERMLMEDLHEVRQKLAQLKALGIRLSVDDFGTGYSSLGHLKELPIDKMKIDRSFVVDLPDHRDSAAIARAIVQMGRSLGITVIAEGVESDAQRAFLAAEACDELQGESISPPLALDAFEHWVARMPAG